jgi:predicted nucleotide-binding protein
MTTSDKRRAAILLLLDDRYRQDPSTSVGDTELAEILELDLPEVRRHLDILEERGLTKAANTHGGHSAWISPRGMEAADRLREANATADQLKDEDARANTLPVNARDVWVVSGRNSQARAAMFTFLRALGLDPVEWDQAIASAGEGSPFVGNVIESLVQRQAIVVILTGDDVVQLHPKLVSPDDKLAEVTLQLQPRPNVVFEAGMALGNRQTRDRTILVTIGKVKLFSNIDGRYLVKMDNSIQARNALANRLKTAGCAVNTVGSEWLNVGDFEGCLCEELVGSFTQESGSAQEGERSVQKADDDAALGAALGEAIPSSLDIIAHDWPKFERDHLKKGILEVIHGLPKEMHVRRIVHYLQDQRTTYRERLAAAEIEAEKSKAKLHSDKSATRGGLAFAMTLAIYQCIAPRSAIDLIAKLLGEIEFCESEKLDSTEIVTRIEAVCDTWLTAQ